jgi:serine/threonine protein phosphatase PrpC
MEDHHIQLLHPEFNEICGIQDQVPRSYFAVRFYCRFFFKKSMIQVFDGHGGPACAQFCTRSIHKNFVNSKFWKPDENESLAEAREKALKDGINSTDKDFCERLTSHGLTTSSGSTAIIAYIEDDTLIVANVGGKLI